MLKLKKLKSTSGWQGNHVAQDCAEWVVTDHPHIILRHLSGDWVAFDTTKPAIAPLQGFQRIASGWTRKMLLEVLDSKLTK